MKTRYFWKKTIVGLFIAVVFCPFVGFAGASSRPGVLQNSHAMVTVDLCSSDSLFGAVVGFADKTAPGVTPELCWFHLHAGGVPPSQKRIVKAADDTVAVAVSGFGYRGLRAELTYTLQENCLRCESRIIADSPVEFNDGLWFDFETSFPRVSPITPNLAVKNMNVTGDRANYSDLNPMVCFHDGRRGITVLNRNPFHSFWVIDGTGKGNHRIDILPRLLPSNEWGLDFGEKPWIVSSIAAGDTIFRCFEVYNGEPQGSLYFWGEHKDGHSPGIAMYWDELPGSTPEYTWRYMTTAHADDVEVDHYLVRLLETHPTMKMGYLLIPDRILYRQSAQFSAWGGDPYGIPDSLDEVAGNWCANVIAAGNAETHGLYQQIPCRPLTRYALSYWMKTGAIEPFGAGGGANRLIIPISDTFFLRAGEPVTGTNEWQRYDHEFTTGPKDTSVYFFFGIFNAKGNAWFDEIRLLDSAGRNQLQNGGFESNSPQFCFDNKRRHWVDAHGRAHITDAPVAYRRFLQGIENGTLTHGWEDRVRLGCHGYHHTPSIDKPDAPPPGWEFQRYDPEGDRLRIGKIFSEVEAIGLTRKSLRFWRSPGLKYTRSLVELLVDSGFVFMDPGVTSGQGAARCRFVERFGKRMWLPELTYWADIDSANTPVKIAEYLREGHLGHIGGHPFAMFKSHNDDFYFRKFDALLASFENACPNLGYVFPDEYGVNANAIYNLRFGNVKRSNDNYTIEIIGKTVRGNSLVVHGDCLRALWNGDEQLEIKKTGDLSYIVLPDAKRDRNDLVVKARYMENYRIPFFSSRRSDNGGGGAGGTTSLYTLTGRRVATMQSTNAEKGGDGRRTFMLKKVPKGVYLYTVENGKRRIQSGLIRTVE